MRKIRIITTLILALVSSSIIVNAQSFEKGSVVFNLSGQYGSFTKKTELNGNSETSTDPRSVLTPLSFEYGITNNLGLGLDLTYEYYFINDNNEENSNRTYDIGISVNYHLLNGNNLSST